MPLDSRWATWREGQDSAQLRLGCGVKEAQPRLACAASWGEERRAERHAYRVEGGHA